MDLYSKFLKVTPGGFWLFLAGIFEHGAAPVPQPQPDVAPTFRRSSLGTDNSVV